MVSQLYAIMFLVAATGALTVAVEAWRRRRITPTAGPLVLLAGGLAEWAVAAALAVLSPDADMARFFSAAVFPGVCAVVAGFYVLSKALLDRFWRLTRRTIVLLAIEPALVVLVLVTNPLHQQFFTGPSLPLPDGTFAPQFGALFWLHSAYSYVVMGSVMRVIGRAWKRAPREHRHLYLWSLLGAAPPIAANIVVLTVARTGADLTVIGFALTTVISYWGLARRSFVEPVPVARVRVFDTVSDVVVVVDRDGRVLDANAAANRLFHQLTAPAPGAVPEAPTAPTRTASASAPSVAVTAAGTMVGASIAQVFGDLSLSGTADTEQTVTDVGGCGVDLDVRASVLRDRRDTLIGRVLIMRDITELNRQKRALRQANSRLRDQLRMIESLRADLAEQAIRDELTGLYNRRYLMDALTGGVSVVAAQSGRLSLALLDIDHFKLINDRYGHGVGDHVLRRFAEQLTGELRPGEIVARHGGEEFVLLMTGVDLDEALTRVEELRALVAADTLRVEGYQIGVTFSAGVVTGTGAESPAALLRAADEALYVAKGAGRNRVEPATFPVSSGPAPDDPALDGPALDGPAPEDIAVA